ncbi:TPA: hypothetical protein N0F65_010385 [Lagenidium giganteum]|uniref:Pyroglutamyl-peptidase I n=1 Tax=Lagenidium giganteum TaxID=4803 RepID=A0AAV2YVD2_9STRA|nr:TPA: hypothetical protein N0F65_010385 [Lagenidium giganteum]
MTNVYVTGFGKFPGMLNNPTTPLAQNLANDPNVKSSKVLETSAEGSREMVSPFRTEAENSGRQTVFLHMGVEPGAQTYAVEQTAYNLADFTIPDERGWSPRRQPIEQGGPQQINSDLQVRQVIGGTQPESARAQPSTDPGRYVCNYIYYQSLRWAAQVEAQGKTKVRSCVITLLEINTSH